MFPSFSTRMEGSSGFVVFDWSVAAGSGEVEHILALVITWMSGNECLVWIGKTGYIISKTDSTQTIGQIEDCSTKFQLHCTSFKESFTICELRNQKGSRIPFVETNHTKKYGSP